MRTNLPADKPMVNLNGLNEPACMSGALSDSVPDLQVTILSPSPGPLPGKFLLAGSLKLFME